MTRNTITAAAVEALQRPDLASADKDGWIPAAVLDLSGFYHLLYTYRRLKERGVLGRLAQHRETTRTVVGRVRAVAARLTADADVLEELARQAEQPGKVAAG